MSSQLNPNAAEFVPVSPTRLLLLDDAIISASSGLPFDKSLENIQVPSELEFSSEISHRPGDLELANGPKRGDDYFMRDNFSTLRNKGKDFSVSSAFSGEGDTSNIPSNTMTTQVSEHIPFDKMEAVQNIEEKENIFGTNNDFSSNAFAATNIFGKSDPMTTSVMGLKDFEISPEVDSIIPDTPKSTTVEAPVSPAEDVSPLNHHRDLDSPTDDHLDTQKTPELMSPGDGPHDALISGQERTSSSGFESESGAEEGDTNVPEESSEGFVTEHRRSPPIDLSFKPIQNFSHTNPFGALQTPTSTTPLDQFNVNTEDQETLLETPKKDTQFDKLVNDGIDFLQNTPSSFICLRSPSKEPVPFNQLESPEEILQFEQPPNANSSFLATELPKSPNPHEALEDVISTLNPEPVHSDFVNESFASTVNVNELTQDLFTDEIIPVVEETSFTTESSHHTIAPTISHVDLDTTEGFLSEESKIQEDEKECEQKSKLEEVDPAENICDISPTTVDQVLTAFDDIKDDLEISSKHEDQEEVKDNIEIETKEMNLEFESHIATSDTTLQDLKNIDDEFEVISKDELTLSDDKELKESESSLPTAESVLQQDNVDLIPSSKQTNPFVVDDFLTTAESEMSKEKEPIVVETSFTNNFASVIDSFDTALKEDLIASDQSTLLSSPVELTSPVEPQATKTVSYQTLTPADEPKLNKIESYVTGIEEEVTKSPVLEETVTEAPKSEDCPVVEDVVISPVLEKNEEVTTAPVIEKVEEVIVAPVVEEPVLIKSEPVQSQVVTETLIATLEDTSEVPLSVATTEVPSSAGTPPPTPAPGIEDGKDDSQKTDILVAAVAAAGAVAAGTAAVVADKEAKKATTGPSKKPAAGVTKKPSETTAKPAGKPAPIKAPAAKPAATKTTTTTKSTSSTATKPALGAAKTATAATKPASSATAPKVPVAKPIAGALAAKKPAPPTKLAATTKPTTSAPKPAVSAVPKTVPKQLSVNKTSTSAMKPSSKPTTPTSKPTTPTTPKSPSVMKSEAVKSPPRPAVRSTLTTSRPAIATTKSDESAEKKPLLNGDIKPLAKKIDVPAKKLVPASKPATTARPAAPIKSTLTATKAVPAKTGAPPQPKAKAPTTTVTKTAMPAPIKRPTPTTTAKPADKTGKETVNKQISNTKPAVNGKTVPAKTAAGNKKTDLKVNAKPTAIKSGPIKKPEEVTKEEEKPTQIQEDNVTTTNGYMEHIIDSNESMKIEELAPVIVDGVN